MEGRIDACELSLDPGPRPAGVTIAAVFLWPGCDMQCRFCASERDFATMDLAWASALLRGLRARGYGNVVLGGGEPALWPHDLPELARRAHDDEGLLVQLNTNGVVVPPGFPHVGGVDRFLLPLEAADAARHDTLRVWSGGSHFARVGERIAALVEAGREMTIATVLTRVNVGEVRALARLLGRLADDGARIHAWHLYRFLPVGRGGRGHAAELALPAERFREACRLAKGSGLGFPVYRRSNMHRSSTVEFFWREGDELVGGRGRRSAAPAHLVSRRASRNRNTTQRCRCSPV